MRFPPTVLFPLLICLLLTALPCSANACAQEQQQPPAVQEALENAPIFVVAPNTVSNISLSRLPKKTSQQFNPSGEIWSIRIELDPRADLKLEQQLGMAPTIDWICDGKIAKKEYLRIMAQGSIIPSDVPFLDFFSMNFIMINKFSLQEALSAAHTICPEKTPFAATVGTAPDTIQNAQGDETPCFDLSSDTVDNLTTSESTGFVKLSILLTPSGREAFHLLTRQHTGERIAFRSQGRILFTAPVYLPCLSGEIIIEADTESVGRRLGQLISATKVEHMHFRPSNDATDGPLAVKHPELVESPLFPVSCENVKHIHFMVMKDMVWKDQSLEGKLYHILIKLTQQGGEDLDRLMRSSERTRFELSQFEVLKNHVQLTAQGQRIISDTPFWDRFEGTSASITMRKGADALAAVRAICPEKAPGQLPEME